jgi:hypothetical protein
MRLFGIACVGALLAMGCGGTPVRVYRGSISDAVTGTGATMVTNTSDAADVTAMQDSVDATRWTFSGMVIYPFDGEATLSGTNLSFGAGQEKRTTESSGDNTDVVILSGSGTMNPDVLTVDLTIQDTQMYGMTTTVTTHTMSFSGQRQ